MCNSLVKIRQLTTEQLATKSSLVRSCAVFARVEAQLQTFLCDFKKVYIVGIILANLLVTLLKLQ